MAEYIVEEGRNFIETHYVKKVQLDFDEIFTSLTIYSAISH